MYNFTCVFASTSCAKEVLIIIAKIKKIQFTTWARVSLILTHFIKEISNLTYVFTKDLIRFKKCSGNLSRLYQGQKLTLRRLMSYIYGAPILDVSGSHTTTQHSR